MHQFELTDDQLQIQEMARKFTADAITKFFRVHQSATKMDQPTSSRWWAIR